MTALTFHRQRLLEAKSEALKAKALGFTDTAREWLMEAYGHRKAINVLTREAK